MADDGTACGMTRPLRFYGYGSCGTCRRALAWLRDHHIPVESIDITVTPPDRDLLRRALEGAGGRARLFNTSGRSYRELGAARVKAMDDEEALAALAADGRLIRRPLLVTDSGAILIGFREAEWQNLLAPPPSP
jgi:arsenate reductase